MYGCGKGAILDFHCNEYQHDTTKLISVGNTDIIKVVAGNNDSCVLLTDGTLFEYKKDFINSELKNVRRKEILRGVKILDIFAGGDHMFAVDEHHMVYGWGNNNHGQLGKKADPVLLPTKLQILEQKKVVQVACGQSHSLMLLKYGGVYAMGQNEHGQLGLRNNFPLDEPKQIDSFNGLPIIRIAAGGWHSFCVTISGKIFSWGRNDFGQLGLGDNVDHSSPSLMKISKKFPVSFISAGNFHSALITREGKLMTFGLGKSGQLGLESLENMFEPTPVKELENSIVTQVACGNFHTVVYVPGCRQVFSFGRCKEGQLGLGKVTEHVGRPEMIEQPWYSTLPRDKNITETIEVNRISAGGDQIYIITRDISTNLPMDYRIIKNVNQIAIFDNFFDVSGTLTNKGYDIDLIIASINCWNASFAGENEVTTSNHHAVDTVQARQFFTQMYDYGIEKASVVYCVSKMIDNLKDKPLDEDALRLYISLPILLETIEDADGMDDIMTHFIKKILDPKTNPWQIIMKWYQSSEDAFVTIIKLCTKVLENYYIKNLSQSCPAEYTDLLTKLNQLNDLANITNYAVFYLSCQFSQQVISQWKLANAKSIFIQFPFLGDAKAKATLLLLDADSRNSVANRQQMRQLADLIPSDNKQHKIKIVVNKKSLVGDTISQLKDVEDLKRPLNVEFQGEARIYDVVLAKEYFMLIVHELITEYELFSEYEDNNFLWFSSDTFSEKEPLYDLFGIVCGLAVHNKAVVGVNFPLALFKKLLGHKPGFQDFMELEPVVGSSFQQLLDFEENDATVEEVFCLTFTSSDGKPLKKGGEELTVTSQNREEYVKLRIDYTLNQSVKKQFEAFHNGFSKACSGEILSIFRPEELREMVVGQQNIDWKKVQQATTLTGAAGSFKQVYEWFWEVLHDFTSEEKRKFIKFLTGSDTIPITDFKITIQQINESDEFMPVALACHNMLQLPVYSSKEILKDRLQLAIQCEGFHRK